jgi:hypothetical protein
MSKSDPHDKLVERIAATYIKKYKAEGFDVAAEYAQRLWGEDPKLTEDVTAEVIRQLKRYDGYDHESR